MLWPFCLLDLLIRICGGFQPVYNGGGGGVGGGHGGGHGGGGDGHIQPFIHGHNGLHRCVDTVDCMLILYYTLLILYIL